MFSLLESFLWQKIEYWDQWLFMQLNSNLTNSFFDALMPFMRTGPNWAPLYLFIVVFVLLNFKGRGGWWVLFFICTVALTDMGGTNIFKHNFDRLRPCRDPDLLFNVRLLVDHCGSGNSFISNHAANHVGMATFFFVTFRHILKKWVWVALIWAGLVAYAQVYVGLHYPLDIIAGSLFGSIIGLTTGKLFNKRYRFAILDSQSMTSL
jgi:undecaprenyl-diphosphatase